jgi:hypothetical protein
MMVAETTPKNPWRVPFYIFLGLCFGLAAFFNQFGIFHDQPIVTKLLGAIAFCGTIGLLADYANRIRYTWFWLIPALAAVEFFGDLIYKAGWWDIARIIYMVSAMLWPVYGMLFIVKGAQLWRTDRSVGMKFIVLGFLASAVLGWEYVTAFPEEYDYSHWGWRSLYLAIFAWLLFIDWTTDFSKRPHLKVQMQIIRVSLLLIAVWYFVRFIFK